MGTSASVTILFTDLVGSTALSQEVGDIAADDVRREHFDVLRQAVGRTGGTEVKSIGDALMVSYPAAADAIAGGVAMQQGLDLRNRRGEGPPLAMRVGISAGDATFEDGDWFGTPVVEAGRVCTAAAGGQILVTDIVRALAGSRVDHELRPAGEIEAKGLVEPLAVCEVVWSPLDEAGGGALVLPLPPVVDQADAFGFVGREAERDALVEAWKEVVAGASRVVLLAGEPGIGKTRLVKEVCRLAHEGGGLVLWGGCEEDLGIPYQPFAEALRWYVTAGPIDELRGLLGPLGGELSRLVADLGGLVPGLEAPLRADPETERYRLFESVVDLLGSLSARSPVLLVLDDLHWAAKPTLLMLRHLSRTSAGMRVLVVATYRDTDLDRTHPLAEVLAALRRDAAVERVALGGLDEQGVADFLERAAGHALDEPGIALARAVHAETEGNPFFISEVLRHLVESDAVVFRDGRYSVNRALDEVGIPEGVREVIGRRLSTLDAATNQVLSAASVVGRDFDVGLLASLSDGGEEAVLDALEAAERAGLVTAVAGRAALYRFAHALVRSTLYNELTTSRRLRLHRTVARALVERPDATSRLPELARHFSECASLGEIDRAVDYGRLAGDAARAELAFEEAASHYERALGALELADDPDPATRADLLRAAGAALATIADPRGRDLLFTAADVARTISDSARLADAAIALHDDWTTRESIGVIDDRMVALLEEALDATDTGDLARRALLMSALVNELTWATQEHRRRSVLADTALDLARRSGDDQVLIRVLAEQWYGYDLRAPYASRGVAHGTEMATLAARRGDPVLLVSAYWQRMLFSLMLGDRATFDADLDAMEALTTQLRQPRPEFHTRVVRTSQALLSGRLDAAERQIAALGEFAASHQLSNESTVTWMAGLTFQLYYERGRLGELESFIAQMVVDQPLVPVWRPALLSVYAATDRLDDAREHLHALAADDFALVPPDLLWVVSMTGIARVAGLARELGIAERAYDRLVPFRDTVVVGAAIARGAVALSLAIAAAALGRFDDAQQLYTEAVDLSERLGAPTFVAETRVRWAQTLLDPHGPHEVTRAHELASQALATAEALGLERTAELSRRVLST